MKTIIVDDEALLLENLKEHLTSIDFIQCVGEFTSSIKALEFVQNNYVDIAILDIEMPSLTGLELAKKIHKINPNISIIFLTSYSQYALNAFDVDAIDYVMKPFSSERLKKALQKAIPTSGDVNHPQISIRTFDGFEVYIGNRQIHFPRKKSKELLALLVDKHGCALTVNEAISYLWEDSVLDDRKVKENYKKCAYTLKQVLKKENIEYILNCSYNSLSVNSSTFRCDYYDFINGDERAINLYHGNYMPSYSWAECTNGFLFSQAKNI